MNTLVPPATPLQAVIHSNPYPYYAALVEDKPFYYDSELRMWVASSAQAVTAVLSSPICHVRPLSEPVPASLQASTAGRIFGALMRMNDGHYHAAVKPKAATALHVVDAQQIEDVCFQAMHTLLDELDVVRHPSHLTTFAFRLPIYVVGTLLGLPKERLGQTEQWTADFVRCIAPGSSPDQVEQGKAAANGLLNLVEAVYERQSALWFHLDHHAPPTEEMEAMTPPDPDFAVTANAIGFLSQAYEATAGLISNSILALSRDDTLLNNVSINPALLPQLIEEVARYDSPVQNTRRFVVKDDTVAAQQIKEGETILVLLAAANHDETVNRNSAQFDLFRPNRVLFTFGYGQHRCPGEQLAFEIARIAVRALVECCPDFAALCSSTRYRPALNTRIPLFMEHIIP